MQFPYPNSKQIDRYLGVVQSKPKMILGLAMVLSVLPLLLTLKLFTQIDTSLQALLPQDFPSVQTLSRIDIEGGKQFEHIYALHSEPQVLVDFAIEAKKILEALPEIERVEIKLDSVIGNEHKFLFLEDEQLQSIYDRVDKKIARSKLEETGFFISLLDEDDEQEIQGSQDLSLQDIHEDEWNIMIEEGSIKEYFLSPDQNAIDVHVYPKDSPSNLVYAQRITEILKSQVQSLDQSYPDLEKRIFGPYRKRSEEYRVIRSDAAKISTFTIIAIILSLMLFYRQFSTVLIISFPLIIGLFWTFGAGQIYIGQLNTMTAFLAGILFGLGIDFCIHMYSCFLFYRKNGESTFLSMQKMLSESGRASYTSALTTSSVFFILMLADFRGFSEFGFMAGLGVLFCFTSVWLLMPALLFWLVQFKSFEKSLNQPAKPKAWNWIPPQLNFFPKYRFVLAASALLIVLFIATLPQFEFEYDLGKLSSKVINYDEERRIQKIFMGKDVFGSSAVLVFDSRKQIPEILDWIKNKKKTDPTPTIKSINTFENIWPSQETQNRRIKIIHNIRDLLNDDALQLLEGKDKEDANNLKKYLDVEPYQFEDVPKSLMKVFSPRNATGDQIGTYAYINSLPTIHGNNGRDAIAFSEDVSPIEIGDSMYYASSEPIVFADVLKLMIEESRWTIGIALLLIFLFVLFDFKSIKDTILVLIPVTFGSLLMLLLLYSWGEKINFYNIIVIPLIIGLGVDDGIHLYHRYIYDGNKDIMQMLRATGRPVWITSVTTFLGFFGLLFSHHQGLQSIGFLACFGISGCLFASVVILPAVLQWRHSKTSKTA